MSETITKKLMLFFPRCECEKPIIYHLVKDYNLVVNVYRAKVTPEEEGYLVLDVTGTEEDIERAMAFVKTFNVSINYSGKGVIRDPHIHRQVLMDVLGEAGEQGLIMRGLMRSPLVGPKGNAEFLTWLECAGEQTASIEMLVDSAVPIEVDGSEPSALSSGS